MSYRFHIVGISLRRHPGDRAYHLRESFNAASIEEACDSHSRYRHPPNKCTVLRDGSTGERYSLAASRDVCLGAETNRQRHREAEAEEFYAEQMRLAATQEPTP